MNLWSFRCREPCAGAPACDPNPSLSPAPDHIPTPAVQAPQAFAERQCGVRSPERPGTGIIAINPPVDHPFREAIRREVGIATGAVGLITEPRQAEEIIATGKADAILMAREFLRDPYWPQCAAAELGAQA